jgi:hypothetical protein
VAFNRRWWRRFSPATTARRYGNDPVNWTGEGLSPGRPNVPGSTYTDADADGLSDAMGSGERIQLRPIGPTRTWTPMVTVKRTCRNTGRAQSAHTRRVISWPLTLRPSAERDRCRGFDVTLSVAANGSAPLSYKWRFNGRDIAGRDEHVVNPGKSAT